MMKIVQRIIEERNHNHKNINEANDIVDVLLKDYKDDESNTISWKNMSENIIEMMIPGEETLPTAMTMAVKFLSDYPLVLSKLLVCYFVYIHIQFYHPCKYYVVPFLLWRIKGSSCPHKMTKNNFEISIIYILSPNYEMSNWMIYYGGCMFPYRTTTNLIILCFSLFQLHSHLLTLLPL